MKINSEHVTAYLLTVPVVVFLLGVFIYPLMFGIYMSLSSTKLGLGRLEFVGLKNFTEVLSSKLFWQGAKNTIIFTIGAVGLTVGIGLLIALLLNSVNRGARIYQIILILPLGISSVVTGMTWQMMFNPLFGIINFFLGSLGLPGSLWHTGIDSAMLSVIIIETWQWTPFALFIIYAGLQMLPEEPFEAAMIDGASSWQRLRYVTLPLVWPAIGIAFMFRLIGAFRSFDIIYTTTKGGPGRATDTLIIQGYQESFTYYRLEYGLVIGLVVLTVTICMCAIIVKRLALK